MLFNILQPSSQYVGYSHIFGDGDSLILQCWSFENFHWIKPMMKKNWKKYKYEYKPKIIKYKYVKLH